MARTAHERTTAVTEPGHGTEEGGCGQEPPGPVSLW